MDNREIGLLLVAIGITAALLGAAVFSGALGWFGRLPGDIRIERDDLRIYVPIASMLIASVVLSALIALVRRLF